MLITRKTEKAIYALSIIGLVFDHLTTVLGLTYFDLQEANIITKNLMNLGIWNYVDVFLCLILIITSHKIIQCSGSVDYEFVLLFPLFSGLFRFIAGLFNLFLII